MLRNIPQIRRPSPSAITQWALDAGSELERWFKDFFHTGVDWSLYGKVDTQTVAADFVILPIGVFIELNSAGAVTSDATVAIENGARGQWIVIQNKGANNITIKHNANTIIKGAADRVLAPNDTIAFRWDMSNWVEF